MSSEFDYSDFDEDYVNLDKYEECYECHRGIVECDCTGGTGKRNAYDDCYACGGRGEHSCPVCGGRAYIPIDRW